MFDLCEGLTPTFVQRDSIDEGYLDLAPCGLREHRGSGGRQVRGLRESNPRRTFPPGVVRSRDEEAGVADRLEAAQSRAASMAVLARRGGVLPRAASRSGKLPGVGAKTGDDACEPRGATDR
jgi:DNA polymerase-4